MRIIGNRGNTARKVQAVASGVLASGDTVVVNADGTVSVIGETPVSQAVGSAALFESANSTYLDSTFDSTNNKFIVAYQDSGNSQKGTAVVGTVNASNNSISFGTPVVFQNNGIEYCAVCYDSTNDRVVIFYHDAANTNYGVSVVGTVSGTTISFGTPVVFASVVARTNHAAFDSVNGKVVNVYRNSSANSTGDAVAGTVSGTTISFGSSSNWASGNQGYGSVTYIGSSKFLIGYTGSSDYGTALIATLSGTSLSYGSSSVFRSSTTYDVCSAYDSSTGKVVIVSRDNSDNGKAIVASISGTTISYGSDVTYASVVSSGDVSLSAISYDSTNNKMVISYQNYANSLYGTLIVGTISGTSISFGTPLVFEAASTNYTTSAFDTNSEKVVIAYRDQGNSNYGTSVVFQNAYNSTNLTSENFIGMASNGYATGQAATINAKGAVADVPATYYDLANASYDSVSFSVNSQAPSPREVQFNNAGTKMYVIDNSNDSAFQYSLSTAFDLSTASYDSVSFSVASQATAPQGFNFNNDGTKMYVVGEDNDTVYQYSLSTGFDLSTASYDSVSFSVASQEATPSAIIFNSDGTKMYICGEISDAVHQYSLSSGFDLSTASYDSVSFDFSSQATQVLSMAFNNDGTKMFLSDAATDTIYQYGLSTAFNVSTASYDSVSFSVASQDGNPHGIAFSSTGDKLFLLGSTSSADTVYQYSTSVSLTAGQSYFVQTNGDLGLTAADPSVFAGTAVSATKLIVKG